MGQSPPAVNAKAAAVCGFAVLILEGNCLRARYLTRIITFFRGLAAYKACTRPRTQGTHGYETMG